METGRIENRNHRVLRQLFAEFKGFVSSRNVPKIKKLIANYIEKVIIYDEHVEVIFKLDACLVRWMMRHAAKKTDLPADRLFHFIQDNIASVYARLGTTDKMILDAAHDAEPFTCFWSIKAWNPSLT
ncbi:hypothetical protein [Paenibacillus alginolyticus]|uniref:Transposase n=2 Tax=Paenibacillus alginolyticus TaxID=59839 RepID=A0ABT4GNP4_9BACL|nr:hypothetical protein [Paenibacillus alginolyticus]MCY9697629.1 hypothetical protein [Paenibacillus alginolyticus]